MELVVTKKAINQRVAESKTHGKIGFVPTMGALHRGHISLVEKAMTENQTAVVSIFVNPTQFNDKHDLDHYPRNLDADLKLLKPTGCQFVFAPAVSEIYPVPDTRTFNFGGLEKVMEGYFRPGHFNGVAQVVNRLFEIVKPDKAYFGLKDFQQLALIRDLVRQNSIPVEIVACPIVREPSGLAMSSRNELLSGEERIQAAKIYQTLIEARNLKSRLSVKDLTEYVLGTINQNPLFTVEYFEIVDELTLRPVNDWNQPCTKVACIAVWCRKTRLIDNIVF